MWRIWENISIGHNKKYLGLRNIPPRIFFVILAHSDFFSWNWAYKLLLHWAERSSALSCFVLAKHGKVHISYMCILYDYNSSAFILYHFGDQLSRKYVSQCTLFNKNVYFFMISNKKKWRKIKKYKKKYPSDFSEPVTQTKDIFCYGLRESS